MNISIQSGGMIYIDGGKNRTTVVHIDDAARLCLLVALKAEAGEVYNASSSTNITAREISEAMAGAMAGALNLPLNHLTRAEATAQFGEVIGTFLTAENRALAAKAKKELGWEPREIGILEEIKKGLYTY
jgi:nucleoside-diphosphate-sugar epimerase